MPTGFPPVADREARLLILGTMPSVASLEKRQYYGHARNAFWPILFSLWEQPLSDDYEQRCRFALDRHLSLWDVLEGCEREGSADASIAAPRPNDFAAFAREHPHICAVFFNSANAQRFYQKLVTPDPWAALPKIALPSTSPARAMTFDKKKELWRPLRQCWEELTA